MDTASRFNPILPAIEPLPQATVTMAEALRQSEERYRLLFDANPIMLTVCDAETLRILDVNEAAAKSHGYTRDELLAMTINDTRPPEDVPAFLQAMRAAGDEGMPTSFWRHRRKDGTIFGVEMHTRPVAFEGRPAWLVMIVDVSERTRLEEHMREIRKMETIGQLAGGVAHDFNNLLTIIHGRSSLLLSSRQVAGDAAEAVRLIREAAERAGDLTRQLLTFSRSQAMTFETVDLNGTVGAISRMLQRVLGEDIVLELKLSPQTGVVRADPSMIDQVLMNLAVNACDAMPRGGRLTVSTSRRMIERGHARPAADLAPGEYACISVADSGVGIPADHLRRIFDPFFTTKELGRRTGLGLATVQAIVRQHRGAVDVISAPNRGTEFTVLLPVAERLPGSAVARRAGGDHLAPGTETILLAEDEQPVREVIRLALTQAGYSILEAEDGHSALELWRRNRRQVDLVLTDVLMPGKMNGHELVAALRLERPALKVIYVSGYSPDIAGRELKLAAGMRYIQKPFGLPALTRSIRDLLDQR